MDLKDAKAAVFEKQNVAEIRSEGDKTKKDYAFYFRYETKRGKVYEGNFINHILTLNQKWKAQAIVSRCFDGVPLDSVEPIARNNAHIAVHLDLSLDIEERPSWAKDFGQLLDDEVLYELWKEIASHEAIFFGRKENEESSAGENTEQSD